MARTRLANSSTGIGPCTWAKTCSIVLSKLRDFLSAMGASSFLRFLRRAYSVSYLLRLFAASPRSSRRVSCMDFYDVLDQVLDLLRQRGRVTYNALKRQFGLDDACLQDLKDEIIAAQRVAMDEDGKVLVWTGDVATPPLPAAAPAAVRVRPPDIEPRAYTLVHLAEKILTARPALAGERKQ